MLELEIQKQIAKVFIRSLVFMHTRLVVVNKLTEALLSLNALFSGIFYYKGSQNGSRCTLFILKTAPKLKRPVTILPLKLENLTFEKMEKHSTTALNC